MYNLYVFTRIGGTSLKWLGALLIPLLNLYAWYEMNANVATAFGEARDFGLLLALPTGLGWAILGWSSREYDGPSASRARRSDSSCEPESTNMADNNSQNLMRLTDQPIMLAADRTITTDRLWIARGIVLLTLMAEMNQNPAVFNIHLPVRSLGSLFGLLLVYWVLLYLLSKKPESGESESATTAN